MRTRINANAIRAAVAPLSREDLELYLIVLSTMADGVLARLERYEPRAAQPHKMNVVLPYCIDRQEFLRGVKLSDSLQSQIKSYAPDARN